MYDESAEMVPPWEAFPTYERLTIGWRMGDGEEYRCKWDKFINQLPADYDTGFGYLKRHRPAPLTWGDVVFQVLYPEAEPEQELGCSPAEIERLLSLGLVEHDAAYNTWLKVQSTIVWPWTLWVGSTPQDAARYCTREFWFCSRQLAATRGQPGLKYPEVPTAWQSVEAQILSGCVGDVDPSQGLTTLAKMLCAGQVQPPWEFGMSPADFANTFEMNMGYADAFRLWIISGFDDDKLLREMLQPRGIPSEWTEWIDEHASYW